jgi:hypothetical protein
MATLEQLNLHLSELRRLEEQAKVGYEQAKLDGNTEKYLGYQRSWFKIQSEIVDIQSKINEQNYINLVINKNK